MKKYISNETGEEETIREIKKEYNILINNSSEFDEYIDNFEQFLKDFYEEVI